MAANRKKPVSLGGTARFGRLAAGHEDASPERLAHAAREGEVLVDAQGCRRLADTFDLLRNRQSLDRQDAARNDLLWQAGARFRRHWHLGRLDNLTAFDFSRESVDGTGGAGATPPTEAALRHRDEHRRAAEAVGGRLLPYLTGIVVEGRTAADLGRRVSDTAHARTAEALAIERLREGLHRLCDHWGMRAAKPVGRVRQWRDGRAGEPERLGG
jgi:hypothetical protein